MKGDTRVPKLFSPKLGHCGPGDGDGGGDGGAHLASRKDAIAVTVTPRNQCDAGLPQVAQTTSQETARCPHYNAYLSGF